MRKLVCLAGLLLSSLAIPMAAQERTNSTPTELSWKSKEVNNALYWTQSSETGKWESRKCSKMVYLGEGVNVPNYHGMFLGVLNGDNYLFLDKRKYHWRYPNLETEWMFTRYIYAALLSSEQLDTLKSLPAGTTVTITPSYVNDMSRAHIEYSFPLFLSLTKTMKETEENKVPFITLKRVGNKDGSEVVRFCLGAVPEMIDISYFEVSIDDYNKLFVPDKKTDYK